MGRLLRNTAFASTKESCALALLLRAKARVVARAFTSLIADTRERFTHHGVRQCDARADGRYGLDLKELMSLDLY
jgi:hypothetical protein